LGNAGQSWEHDRLSVAEFWGLSHMRAHSMRNNSQILLGDRTRFKILQGQARPRYYSGIKYWWHERWRSICLR